MLKQDFIKSIATECGLTQVNTREILEVVTEKIASTVLEGREAVIVGSLRFKPKTTAARTARNPSTGAAVQVPEKTKIAVSVSK